MLKPSAAPPTLEFSTRAFAKRAQLAALHEVFGRTVCGLDIAPLEPATFSSDANVYQLPGLGVLFAASGGMALSHTRDLIVDDDLSFMAAPSCRYAASQLGRTVELDPGDGVLITNAEVGSMTLASVSDFITFRVPRLPCWCPISTPPWPGASRPTTSRFGCWSIISTARAIPAR